MTRSRKHKEAEQRVVLGSITGVFGVKGWVKVWSDTLPTTNILDYSKWQLRLADGWRTFELAKGRVHGKGIIALMGGIEDRNQAAELVGSPIAIDRSELPVVADGEYYWADLEGLEVRGTTGIALGRVVELFATGSNDVLVVQGERQRLIPFTEDAVLEVDLKSGLIVVDWDPDF